MRALAHTAPLMLAGAAFAPAASAGKWPMAHDESRLGLPAVPSASEFEGVLEFHADMAFYRDRPEGSAFDVEVDVTRSLSERPGTDCARPTIVVKTGFWLERYPTAHLETNRIRRQQASRYVVVADLTTEHCTHAVERPSNWELNGDVAAMAGTATAMSRGGVTMDRTRSHVGTGDWSDGDTAGREVDVHVDLTLHRVGDG